VLSQEEVARLLRFVIPLSPGDALTALALIELCLAEPPGDGSKKELSELLDKWALKLRGVAAVDIDRLKNQLGACGPDLDPFAPTLEQSI
jgi:hypothetical protein